MTLADMRRLGARCVEASCEACGHGATVNVDLLPAGFPDVALRLRCAECRSKRIMVRLNIGEVYAQHRGHFG